MYVSYLHPYYIFRLRICRLCRAIMLLQKRDDLHSLSRWAKQRKLHGPHGAYQRKLCDVEAQIAIFQMRHPSIFKYAQIVSVLSSFLHEAWRQITGFEQTGRRKTRKTTGRDRSSYKLAH